jgi:hypothetical protein
LAGENLPNTNKELKPIGDVEYGLKEASISMVNGTLMAKCARDQVNESRALRHLISTNGARLAIGKSGTLYFDFNVLGPKCGPILLAHVVRAAPKRIKYVGGSTARGLLLSVLLLRLGW